MTARIESLSNTEQLDPKSVLVAIPTWNEEAHIADTIERLMGHDSAMQTVKIVVADGDSQDRTREIVLGLIARYPNLHLIDNPARLQAAAVNRVVEECAEPHHDILVRVDAHSFYSENYVLRVAQSLRTRQVAALATVMDSIGSSCFQRGAAWAMETRIGSGGSSHRGGTKSGYVDHGHHAGFRLDVWRRVGGYNTGFVANEDAELDHRIRLAGGKIWLDASIRSDYIMRDSLAKLARQYWRYGKGRAQTVLLHRVKPRLRQMVPPAVLIVNILSLALSPTLPQLTVLPAVYLALLVGVAISLCAKHRSLCALWAAPALFVMHQVWGAGFLSHMASNGLRRSKK